MDNDENRQLKSDIYNSQYELDLSDFTNFFEKIYQANLEKKLNVTPETFKIENLIEIDQLNDNEEIEITDEQFRNIIKKSKFDESILKDYTYTILYLDKEIFEERDKDLLKNIDFLDLYKSINVIFRILEKDDKITLNDFIHCNYIINNCEFKKIFGKNKEKELVKRI